MFEQECDFIDMDGEEILVLKREATPVECLIFDLKRVGLLMLENKDVVSKYQYPLVLRVLGTDKKYLLSSFWGAEEYLRNHNDGISIKQV